MDFYKISMDNYEEEILENALKVPNNVDQKVILENLQKCMDFYKRENEDMENLLEKFNNVTNLSKEANNAIEDLLPIQEKYGCKEIDPDCATMSGLILAEQMRKQDKHLSKIKLCLSYYNMLNEKVSDEIKYFVSELDNAENKLVNMQERKIEDEITSIKCKINTYEKQIQKVIGHNPWLKDPNLNVPAILKEIDTLNQLELEKHQLEDELKRFCGIKPDILQARQQLRNLTEEYNKYNKL